MVHRTNDNFKSQNTSDTASLARAFVASLLDGDDPGDITPDQLGPFADLGAEMLSAWRQVGTDGARRVFAAYAASDPAIAALRAADPEPGAGGRLADAWRIRTLSDAYAERPPTTYLVDGLLPCPSLSIFFGPPGSYKTMLTVDMAVCVAGGLRWLEPLPGAEPGISFATKQAPVLIIDFDNGKALTDERIDALARARMLPIETPIHYVSMPTPWLDASDLSMVFDLGLLIKSLGAKLVIIDNLGLITGDQDENSAQMSQVMGHLRWLCEECDCAIVVIHHQRKTNGETGSRKGETLRGSVAIEASLDIALLIERGEGDTIIATATKVRRVVAHGTFAGLFTYRHRPNSLDLETARFWSQPVETKAQREIETIESAVIEELKKFGDAHPTQKELADAVRVALALLFDRNPPGVNKVRGVINTMAERGDLVEEPGDRKTKRYSLPRGV